MQCTFSAESVVLTLSNWASHSEICELHILVRVDKTVSARHVSAAKSMSMTVIGLFLVPQIDPSVPHAVVQSRRRPLLGPSPG